MQYILTEEEFKALKEKQEVSLRLSEKKLQTLCTKICNEMPVQWGWGSNKNDPEYLKPWGCIITAEQDAEKNGGYGEWYCDECPVSSICPHPHKSWSQ